MPHPAKGYYTKDGKRVPGTTTITGRFKKSDALLYWAWDQGRQGKDFRETKQFAADAGTCCHEMIECWKHKSKFDETKYQPDVLAKAMGAYNAFLEWAEQTKLEIVETEIGLVSELHRFGGTLDAILLKGKLTLGDWKTSSNIYSEMLSQVAGGYSLLWQEHFPDKPLTGVTIVRFSKQKEPDDPISFHSHWYSDEIFPIAQKHFLLLRAAYESDKKMEGLV